MDKKRKDIENLINELNEVADLFYKQKNELANAKFNAILYQIEINIDSIMEAKTENDKSINANNFNQILNEAVNAMINQDNVLLADILKFELTEELKKL